LIVNFLYLALYLLLCIILATFMHYPS